jgi:hypothetical protein
MVTGQLSLLPGSASEKVRPKKSYFSSASEYVKLSFSLRVPKNFFFHICHKYKMKNCNCLK